MSITKLAVLRDTPADAIMHAQGRPTIGTQQFILPGNDHHICLPLFLERNNGNIQRFLLMKAFVPDPLTNQAQRQLQPVWLLIPGNPRISIGADQTVYFGDQSEGMIYMHQRMLREAKGNKSIWNAMTCMVTMRDMPVVPNAKYMTKEDGTSNWNEKLWNIIHAQHTMLCGGIVTEAGKEGEEPIQREHKPLMSNSEEFQTYMKLSHENTEKFLRQLVQGGLSEANTVFEVLPGSIQMAAVPYYNNNVGEQVMNTPFSGIRRFSNISSWGGIARIDVNTDESLTGNGQKLQHGVRETMGRYAFDRMISLYDRRMNMVNAARLSMIDPVTIRYLEGQAAAQGHEEDDAVDSATTNRRSRAKVLEEVVQGNRFVQFNNTSLKVHPNGSKPESMAIMVELVIGDHSTYTGVRDTSKIGAVAGIGDEEDALAVLSNSVVMDFDAIMNGTNTVNKVVKPAEGDQPAPASTTGLPMAMDDELPF